MHLLDTETQNLFSNLSRESLIPAAFQLRQDPEDIIFRCLQNLVLIVAQLGCGNDHRELQNLDIDQNSRRPVKATGRRLDALVLGE